MKNIIDLLNKKSNVDEYTITKINTSSTELFFIKEELQMNRGKDITDIEITVYRNFEENGKKYKGSSTTKIAPTMNLEEIETQIDTASLAASFVKNEFYTLEQPSKEIAPIIPSKFNDGDVIENITNLVKDLYEEDNQFGSFINSTEFFISKKEYHFINSNGIDVSYNKFIGEIELITEANGETESIELFDVLEFSDYVKDSIKLSILEALKFASLRAKAIPMPIVDDIPVILNGIAAKDLWSYYSFNTSAAAKYNHLHNNNVGDNIQGKTLGDKVTITMKPYIENSTLSSYYDSFGTFLKDTIIIQDGIIKNMSANRQYADYLKIPCTGGLRNTVIEPGSYTEKELKVAPYLEILKFSAFQSDVMTGNFGGEFRLGIYNDGTTEIPVTLGSIAANMKDVQGNMYLSKELIKSNNFIGPKFIKFDHIRIAGN